MTAFDDPRTAPATGTGPLPMATVITAPVTLLRVFCFLLFVFPADSVIKTIGGTGFPAGLFALLLLGIYVVEVLLGLHRPIRDRSPARSVLALLWLASAVSYVFIPWWGESVEQHAAADRWMLLVLGAGGVVLVASEALRSFEDVVRVTRAAVTGGAFSGFVALVQFFTGFDLAPFIRMAEPGFSLNGVAFGSQLRAGLLRVAGTSTHPIELAVTSGMLLAPAAWLFTHDRSRDTWRRALPLLFLLGGVTSTVSRSGIIAVLLAFGLYAVLLPPRSRVWAIGAVPFAAVAVFVSIPGFVRTISDFFTAGDNDPSVANRTNNYPFVAHLVSQHPWFGTGGGTYIAHDLTKVFDNQYLTSAIGLGLVGVSLLLLYLLLPVPIALYARTHARDPGTRALLAALAGSALAATVCSATFDSFSFAVFVFVDAVALGLVGAVWRLIRDDPSCSLPHVPAQIG